MDDVALTRRTQTDRWTLLSLFCGEDESHNKTVEPQDLCKDQEEDHAHEEPGLLGRAPNTCIAHNADGETSRQPTQPHTQPSTQVEETPTGER